MQATVKREVKMLAGKPRKPGDVIEPEALERISQQALQALIDGGYIEIAGMSRSQGEGMGGAAHLRARQDQLDDRVKKLETANSALLKRLEALETKKKPGPKPKAGSVPAHKE